MSYVIWYHMLKLYINIVIRIKVIFPHWAVLFHIIIFTETDIMHI